MTTGEEQLEHEHCLVCWNALWRGDTAYQSDDGLAWLCSKCYGAFIAEPRFTANPPRDSLQAP